MTLLTKQLQPEVQPLLLFLQAFALQPRPLQLYFPLALFLQFLLPLVLPLQPFPLQQALVWSTRPPHLLLSFLLQLSLPQVFQILVDFLQQLPSFPLILV